jgi:hypothetical protein
MAQYIPTREQLEADPRAELTPKQRIYVDAVGEGKTREEAKAIAGYSPNTNSTPERNDPRVRAAVLSLLQERDAERAKDFRMSKDKILQDLELAKQKVLEAIDEDPVKGASALNAFNRSCELQGRELGMFNQKHFHEHTHEIVPDKALLERLSKTNPELANRLSDHLGVVIDGEFTEEES